MLHVGACCDVFSVLCSLVVTCWENADPLAVVCVVLSLSQICPGPHQNQGWGWRHKTGLSPPVKYFTDRSKEVLLLWIFYVFVRSCVCYVLCASVYMCFVVTCWERADLLALVCGVFCEFITFPLVSWVRCGTWLYRFLIFATLLPYFLFIVHIICWKRKISIISIFSKLQKDTFCRIG